MVTLPRTPQEWNDQPAGSPISDSISGRGEDHVPVDSSGRTAAARTGLSKGLLSPKFPVEKGVTVIMGYKPIEGAQAADHSYIKIVGPDRREFFLRGGPGPDADHAASGGAPGILTADSVGSKSSYRGDAHFGTLTVDTGHDALDLENNRSDDATKVLGRVDMTFDDAMQKLIKFKNDVNAAKIKYWPLSTNSNAVAHQAATVLGLPRPADPIWTSKSGFMFTPGASVILTNRGRELGH
ncbi:MAG TPA: hypothetical protein VJP60_08200 [Rhizomicrobium sp.]|nr:hypothetical protein [Rhizomicrobium sp.]